jgi:hypothetical protein
LASRIGLSTVIGNTASERVAPKPGYVFVAEVENWIHPPTGKAFDIKAWVRARESVRDARWR